MFPIAAARAYGVRPAQGAQARPPASQVAPAAATARSDAVRDHADLSSSAARRQKLARVIAASVDKQPDFQPDVRPEPGAAALPFYRHPADKNAAAVSIDAGRSLDIQG
ncbi:MAG: hypothetical protein DYG92_05410 [Leptolyngbya sp. PLA1]|nr:hypothetical protein [Leptolyngbya sp. PLA1]